ncbi:MAG: N-acetylmuramoyl-L-alanine amidase [Gracilibacteraceae bacterium]|jgi:N-acetylmuramoyl-L-alanine amidase|nr:N-acetylmuramoyl-L-alanine amidase [Gracilibacteraceae bacterium]
MKIFINPGHGGADPGSIGATGLREVDVTYAIALLVAEKLAAFASVRLFQQKNSLLEVAKESNHFESDWFLSIHCNSFADSAASGTETYYFPGSIQGKAFAETIQRECALALGRAGRGVKEGHHQVLRETKAPAAFTELLCITNPVEETMLRNIAVQEQAAEAIAQGISKHCGLRYHARHEN